MSRPLTPDSPSSLSKATATIDDLTRALTHFTHLPSPEPPELTLCCCNKEDCEHRRAWAAYKAKLEDRLTLSAEVGQALLERHEAYVRQHEPGYSLADSSTSLGNLTEHTQEVSTRVAELVRENAVLEKRFSQALVHNEFIEVAHQKTLAELKDAKEKIAILTTQNARLVGVDKRLSHALQEKDDIQQECNSATQRVRTAETRVSSLKERCAKLQAHVSRLREDLEVQRSYRKEFSEEILTEARSRLQHLQHLDIGASTAGDDDEITKVLESLVADNEALKHDNAELQNLLSEAREDLRVLQEEIDERRADTSYSRHRASDSIGSSTFQSPHSPLSSTFLTGTAPASSMMHSVFGRQTATPSSSRRALSTERDGHLAFEPLTPETNRRPLSPTEFMISSRLKKPTAQAQPRSQYARSHLSLELEEHDIDEQSNPPDTSRLPKSLLLLTRSRAVQTDDTGIPTSSSSPIPRPFGEHIASQDGQSDSSSVTENSTTVIGVLVDRISLLLNRLMQADALTLTTRLKRQHLLGADVSHLSRTTVSGILNESNALRMQFRAFLEDEKITTTCTRRDLRALFKLFKDMFTELGQLRVTLNDVILDPTVAGRVSDLALRPSQAKAGAGSDQAPLGPSSGPNWMVPLSKFLGLPGSSTADDAAARALAPPVRPTARALTRPPARIVPKREAALAASATTVNVEFSGGGVGRAVTSTASSASDLSMLSAGSVARQLSSGSGSEASKGFMDIFAGAPRPADGSDPWVVIPKPQRTGTLGSPHEIQGTATLGRTASRSASLANFRRRPTTGRQDESKKLSQIVDAILDTSQSEATVEDEARDVVSDTLLERTLRPRGLSDSSIHTTYMSQATEGDQLRNDGVQTTQDTATPDKQSVLQTLSRKMQSFRLASSSFIPPSRPAGVTSPDKNGDATPSSEDKPSTSQDTSTTDPTATITPRRSTLGRAVSPSAGLFQNLNLSSWAAAALPPDTDDLSEDVEPGRSHQFYPGTVREDSDMRRAFPPGR
ncbi:hypothetical protein BDW22DRAFT_1430533 [Trametopsis cervina]|nr:hypothetical protein BDW22DRAFT_1430533 [Trametopsis cervina]